MKKIGIIIALLLVFIAEAQDVHFSQFYASPINLNPALTGVFNAKIRSNINYRSQWGGFADNGAAFTTYAFSTDMRISPIQLKRNFMGVGLSFYNDKAGAAGLYTQNVGLSNSVGINFSKKKVENILVLGYQFSLLIRGLQYSNLTFGSQYVNNNFDATAPTNESRFDAFRFGYDLSMGTVWLSKPRDEMSFYIGGAAHHITGPNQSFFKTGDEKLAMRMTIHGGMQYNFARMFEILPTFQWSRQGLSSETVVGLMFAFAQQKAKPDPKAPMVYVGGLTRFGDAFILVGGLKMGQAKVGISYDVNLSPLTNASRFKGGPEVSLELLGNFSSRKSNFTIAAPRI